MMKTHKSFPVLLILASLTSLNEVHSYHNHNLEQLEFHHKSHLRHHHIRFNEFYTINDTNSALLSLKHGHYFYGRHKRKYFEEMSGEHIHWPNKQESVVEGDVILGGLMMVHEREDNATCGPIMPQGGIQALEAMLFTLDRINEMKLFGPDVKIGALILDDCDKDTYGLEMAVDFIKADYTSRTVSKNTKIQLLQSTFNEIHSSST
ncbi:unnamed protein product [Chironomus riparius]|uniref:Receptor ligand binding region domain-containing protein n=1 Tax=Chironomus riparius TaxID=315576 RepID=A0A9N9S7F6_9DIPT|nr:unnamed protein product [Chironomus riparius]